MLHGLRSGVLQLPLLGVEGALVGKVRDGSES